MSLRVNNDPANHLHITHKLCARGGQRKSGVERGPASLLKEGLIEDLEKLGWQVEFGGHLEFTKVESDPDIGKLKNPLLVSQTCLAVAESVGSCARAGKLSITLGGDHSLVSLARHF